MKDLVGVVEACYESSGSEEEWLAGLASAAHPFLDGGFGVLAAALTAGVTSAPAYRSIVTEQMRPEVARALKDASEVEETELVVAALRRPVSSVRSVFGADYDSRSRGRTIVEPLGIQDSFCVTALNADGAGVVLSAPLATPRPLTPPLVRRWSRIAAHMAAGLRLRKIKPSEVHAPPRAHLASNAVAADLADEVPGRSLRDALREAAIAVDLARGPRRVTDPNQANEAWQALVEGHYALVDHFDHGGRHFLVARANAPAAAGPSSLNARERQVVAFRAAGHPLKLIGYELGLSVATVSRTLTCAMRKLGVRSHVELARTLGSTGT